MIMTIQTTNIRYVKFDNAQSLTEYVEGTIAKAKTLKDRIQISAVGVLMHIGQHGDYDTGCKLINKMVDELGQGIQVKALIDWSLAFGAQLADDNKSFASWDIDLLKLRFNASSSNPKEIAKGAKGTHWCSFAPVNPWAGFKLDQKLEALLNQAIAANDRASKNPEESSVVEIDQAKFDLLAVIATMSPEQCHAFKASLPQVAAEPEQEIETFVNSDAIVEAQVA
jgi:hypothetical protein